MKFIKEKEKRKTYIQVISKLAGGLSFPTMLFFQPLAQNLAIDDMKPLKSMTV